jgi:hypothetical protein
MATAAPGGAPDAAPGLRCGVCACAVELPLRGTPSYRKLLACNRLHVCPDHLTPGVHLLDGKRVRYCTNHHTLHDAAEFEAASSGAQPSRATSQTTCTRARSLSLARIKRQRSGGGPDRVAAKQPSTTLGGGPLPPPPPPPPLPPPGEPLAGQQLVMSLPLPVELDDGELEEALFGWPFFEEECSPCSLFGPAAGGDDDPFSCPLLPKQQPRATLPLALEEWRGGGEGWAGQHALPVLHTPLQAHAAAAAPPAQQQQVALPLILRSPVVEAATSQLHRLATSPHMAVFLRCFAGDKARAHVGVTPSAVRQYIWVRQIFHATLMARTTRMVTALHDSLRSLVLQARQDIVATRGPDAPSELVQVVGAVHAMATRRGALLTSLAKRTSLLSPSILLMIAEFKDGNDLHLHNLGVLLQLAHSAAAAGDPEARAEVVRLVSEFSLVQVGLVRDALAERASWLDGLSTGSGGAGGARFDIRRGVDVLWQSVQQSWVSIHEDAFTEGAGRRGV